MHKSNHFLFLFLLFLGLTACKNNTTETTNTATETKDSVVLSLAEQHLDWSKNATIYEVNLRQYSKEGTFNAFTADLPRIKKIGVDILWLMPIFPISETKRKGKVGSFYSVDDYTAVNPDHGTLEDFKTLVKTAHGMDMKVILDWVPNHTGWDNPWIKDHPEWYTKDSLGQITEPLNEKGESTGWTDVADLNYDNQDMRKAMIDALKFWITECDVDGYRCDVAGFVPNDFWKEAIAELQAVKPVFMLAEWEDPEHHNAGFDMSYGWESHHVFNAIAKGEKTAKELDEYLKKDREKFPKGAYRMMFTSNHDENSWNGTVFDRMGDAHKALAVLSATFESSMPLLYSGQEAPLKKKLEFFEKDVIDWNGYKYQDFYTTLFQFKKSNKALWNGQYGGEQVKVNTDKDDEVYAFTREKDGDKVLVVLNLSKNKQEVALLGENTAGEYTELFSKGKKTIKAGYKMKLGAWDYKVFY